jgi:hypothetical protein
MALTSYRIRGVLIEPSCVHKSSIIRRVSNGTRQQHNTADSSFLVYPVSKANERSETCSEK